MTYYAVVNDDLIEFVGSWNECKDHVGNSDGRCQVLPIADKIWPSYDDQKLAIATLNRDLDQYKMLYKVTNDDFETLIQKNSDLITLVTSMSNFITTHMEGR